MLTLTHLNRSTLMAVSLLALACALIQMGCSEPHTTAPLAPSAPQGAHSSGFSYVGPLSMDEMVAYAEVIVHAELESISAGTIRATDEVREGNKEVGIIAEFMPILEASFRVIEYIKGSGDSRITVVISDERDQFYATNQEALNQSEEWKNARSTRWDDRQAMLFLRKAETANQLGHWVVYPAGTYRFVGLEGGPVYPRHYSIDNEYTRVWLPSASAPGGASGSSDDIRFLTEAPPEDAASAGAAGSSGTAQSAPSISKGELRSRITQIDSVFQRGAGIEGYDECVRHMYREDRMYDSEYGRDISNPVAEWHFDSGLAAGTVLRSATGWGAAGSMDIRIRTSGPDSDLFIVGVFNLSPNKSQGDIQIRPTRPIPEGVYRYRRYEQLPEEIPCDYYPEERTTRETVYLTAPEGTLHEAFFDPVLDTSTSAVGADSTNGVLKPSAFTDYGGSTTTIGSLEWKSDVVKMSLSPRVALGGHVLDFIEMDGSVSLSLDVTDAAIDAANNTLSWSVASQPWEDGDTLMLRIRRGPNRPPVFDTSTYAFTVREDASAFHVIGYVSATDPDVGDSPWYYITGGNEAGRFRLGANNGEVLVWKSLDYETASAYTLTVEARDGRENGTTTATVEISVTDVDE